MRLGVLALGAQLGEEQQRVRIAQHALRHAGDRRPEPLGVERAADAHRRQHVAHQRAAVGVGGFRRPDLLLDRRALGIGDARHRRFHRRAALEVDDDGGAVFLQGIELLLRAQHEALEHERRVGPRPIELGDVHAEPKLRDGNSSFHPPLTLR